MIAEEHGTGPNGTYSGTSELQLERIKVFRISTLIIAKISEQYPNRLTATFSTFLPEEMLAVMVQSYNTILFIQQLAESVNATYYIDNESFHGIDCLLSNDFIIMP
ncbi:unnamed protein product [Acanthocheilonema viteae]|uniref:Tubulin/FtsZ GTPase domain-containing protein n=1 Tax=Acanthocheilonema viteae TaxID=6277 RepID=A0A498SA31_ACAVI|nr:unnamed protein product [Acanthocheilonema viteae]